MIEQQPIEAAARAAFIEDAAVRMRSCVATVHAGDAYRLEQQRAAERWDDPNVIDTEYGQRNLCRRIARAAIVAYLRAEADVQADRAPDNRIVSPFDLRDLADDLDSQDSAPPCK